MQGQPALHSRQASSLANQIHRLVHASKSLPLHLAPSTGSARSAQRLRTRARA